MTSVALFCVVFINLSITNAYADTSTNNFPQSSLNSCPDKCSSSCNQTFCFACEIGYKGDKCEHLCSNCRPATQCDKTSGYCFEHCRDGLSGETCNETCHSKCISCDRLNKNNCTACAYGRYGMYCSGICPQGCLHNSCNGSDGVCSIGCSAGYWGQNCKHECPHCKGKICDNSTSECLNGCEDGYGGLNCTTSASHTNFVGHFALTVSNIGMVFGLGIVAIVTIVIVIICVKRRLDLGRRILDEDNYDVIATARRMQLRLSGTLNRRGGR